MSVTRYALPTFSGPDGDIRILEFPKLGCVACPDVPRYFEITRVEEGVLRGGHAHRQCCQTFRVTHGCATLKVWEPGRKGEPPTFQYNLHLGADVVHVPPWHWVEITTASESCVLQCFANETYEPADYIHDRDEFEAGP